jgi:hypothetical protein
VTNISGHGVDVDLPVARYLDRHVCRRAEAGSRQLTGTSLFQDELLSSWGKGRFELDVRSAA